MKYKQNRYILAGVENDNYSDELLFIITKNINDNIIDNNNKIRILFAELLEVDEYYNYWLKTSKVYVLNIHFDEHDAEYFNFRNKKYYLDAFSNINAFNRWYNTNNTKDILIKY